MGLMEWKGDCYDGLLGGGGDQGGGGSGIGER